MSIPSSSPRRRPLRARLVAALATVVAVVALAAAGWRAARRAEPSGDVPAVERDSVLAAVQVLDERTRELRAGLASLRAESAALRAELAAIRRAHAATGASTDARPAGR